MTNKQKLNRIIGVTDWSRDHLADLLDVSNATLGRWLKGRGKMQEKFEKQIDNMFEKIVKPLDCEIDRLSDQVEEEILKTRIKSLKDDDCCEV